MAITADSIRSALKNKQKTPGNWREPDLIYLVFWEITAPLLCLSGKTWEVLVDSISQNIAFPFFEIIIHSLRMSVTTLRLNLPKQHKTLKHKTVTVKNKTEDKLHTTNKHFKLMKLV